MEQSATPSTPESSGNRAVILIIAAMVVAALIAVVVISQGSDSGKATTKKSVSASGPTETLKEFSINPSNLTVRKNATLNIQNDGSMGHDYLITGTNLKTPILGPGKSTTIKLNGLAPGKYVVYCNIAGHEAAGMKGTLVVK